MQRWLHKPVQIAAIRRSFDASYQGRMLSLFFKDEDGTHAMNLLKIRKYLIRQQFSDPRLNNPDENKERFEKLSFKEILEDLNINILV